MSQSTGVGRGPQVLEPLHPGLSRQLIWGGPLVRYVIAYAIASVFLFAAYSGLLGIVLPNQVQDIEKPHYFTSQNLATYRQAIADLRGQIASGELASAAVTGDQRTEIAKSEDQLTDVNTQVLSNLRSQQREKTLNPTAAQATEIALFTKYDGSKASNLSMVISISAFFTLFAQPLVGVISDRWRSRWGRRSFWIVAGAAAGAVFMIGLQTSTTIAMVALFWVIVQICLNFMQAPLTTTIADRIPAKKRGMVSGISGIGTMIGGMGGSILAGALIISLGLKTYYVFGIGALAGAIVFVLVAKDTPSKELHVEPFSWKEFFTGFARPLKDSDYRWTWLARFALILGYYGIFNFNLYLLQGYVHPALSEAQANLTAPMLSLVSLPGMLIAMIVGGRWSDKAGRRKPFVIWASLGTGACMLLPLLWPVLPAMFIQNALIGFFFGAYMAIDQALFIDVLPNPDEAGKDLGVANAATNLGQTLGPVAGGAIVNVFGGYSMVYVWAIIWTIIGALAVLPIKRVR